MRSASWGPPPRPTPTQGTIRPSASASSSCPTRCTGAGGGGSPGAAERQRLARPHGLGRTAQTCPVPGLPRSTKSPFGGRIPKGIRALPVAWTLPIWGNGGDSMRRVIILGAAGRDFFNFFTVYRDDPEAAVVAFTAQQIPHIADRRFPPELAGPRYPKGIPIYAESRLEELVKALDAIDQRLTAHAKAAGVALASFQSNIATGADFV